MLVEAIPLFVPVLSRRSAFFVSQELPGAGAITSAWRLLFSGIFRRRDANHA